MYSLGMMVLEKNRKRLMYHSNNYRQQVNPPSWLRIIGMGIPLVRVTPAALFRQFRYGSHKYFLIIVVVKEVMGLIIDWLANTLSKRLPNYFNYSARDL